MLSFGSEHYYWRAQVYLCQNHLCRDTSTQYDFFTGTPFYHYSLHLWNIMQNKYFVLFFNFLPRFSVLSKKFMTKKDYIWESTFIYQKSLRKHMQGGVSMPCGVLDNYTCGKKRYTILKRNKSLLSSRFMSK